MRGCVGFIVALAHVSFVRSRPLLLFLWRMSIASKWWPAHSSMSDSARNQILEPFPRRLNSLPGIPKVNPKASPKASHSQLSNGCKSGKVFGQVQDKSEISDLLEVWVSTGFRTEEHNAVGALRWTCSLIFSGVYMAHNCLVWRCDGGESLDAN